jgi:hypothetical protein
MTPKQTQEVKEKIIEAVPEIMELKFGCYISGNGLLNARVVGGSGGYSPEYDCIAVLRSGSRNIELINLNENYYEILGRPIQLADVLRAINAKDGNGEFYCIDAQGDFGEPTPEGVAMFGVKWDLSKDFDGQSDETKTFIYNILIKKL